LKHKVFVATVELDHVIMISQHRPTVTGNSRIITSPLSSLNLNEKK